MADSQIPKIEFSKPKTIRRIHRFRLKECGYELVLLPRFHPVNPVILSKIVFILFKSCQKNGS